MVDQRAFFVNIDEHSMLPLTKLSHGATLCLYETQGKSPNLSMSLPTHYDDTTTQNQGREDHKKSHNNSKVETGMWHFILCRSYSCAVVCPLLQQTRACNALVNFIHFPILDRVDNCQNGLRFDFSELLIYTRFEFHSLSCSRSSWRLPKWYGIRLLWASDLYKVLTSVQISSIKRGGATVREKKVSYSIEPVLCNQTVGSCLNFESNVHMNHYKHMSPRQLTFVTGNLFYGIGKFAELL